MPDNREKDQGLHEGGKGEGMAKQLEQHAPGRNPQDDKSTGGQQKDKGFGGQKPDNLGGQQSGLKQNPPTQR